MSEIVVRIYLQGEGASWAKIEGKFLQLQLGTSEILLFAAPELYAYHNQILARFLQERSIPHKWAEQGKLEYDCSELLVIGGGRFRVSLTDRTLTLWDNSQAYGRFRASGLEQKIALASHPWSGYTVRIS